MGKLIYGPWRAELQIEDRTLHHLRVVILGKLRRGEAFSMTWESSRDEGSGQDLIWLHPSIPMQMRFNGNRQPSLNRAWIDALMLTANENTGLRLVEEPDDRTRGARNR
jgi:hypothetical protein